MQYSFFLRLFPLVFCFGSLSPLQAQFSSAIDSLENVLAKTADPYDKANLYYNLGKLYLRSDFDKSSKYAQQAMQLYPSDKFDKQGNCYTLLGIIAAQTSNPSKALHYLDSASYFYQKIKDQEGLAIVYSNTGAIYININQHNKGAEYLYKSLAIHEQNKDTNGIVTSLNNLLAIHVTLFEYNKAQNIAHKIFNWVDTNSYNGSVVLAMTTHSMGNIFFNQQKLDSSLYYYQKTIPLFQKLNNREYLAIIYSQCAEIYALQKQAPK